MRARSPGPGLHVETVSVDGLERRYLVYVPLATTNAPLPVVCMLHGTSALARWTIRETGWGVT